MIDTSGYYNQYNKSYEYENEKTAEREDELSEYRRIYTEGRFVNNPCKLCGHQLEDHYGFVKRRHLGLVGCQVETDDYDCNKDEYGVCGCNLDPGDWYLQQLGVFD